MLVRYTPSSLTSSTWLMQGKGAGVRFVGGDDLTGALHDL